MTTIPTAPMIFPTPTDPLAAFGPLVGRRTADGFDDRPYERLTVHPLSPTIGAEVDGVRLGGDLDEQMLGELRRALLEWKVLVFRDQDIDRTDQRAFAQLWGELEQHPFFKYTQPGQTDIDVVTLAKDAMTAGTENNWHNDITWHTTPSFGAVLRAVEVPEVGGDTLWTDTGLAYDLLPQDIRDRIDPLVAEHDWIATFGRHMPAEAVEQLRTHFPPVQHPVVRVVPETGRRALFVNMIFTQRILGIPAEESDELLRLLYRHVQRPEFQCRLRWRPNTIAFWDNRSCQHYASSDYFPARRVMDRISIVGDRPVGV
ncbi:taurine dioxygenase [Rhodococcus sp. D2-41]|uniref:TauD/TfdA family dioxygenase n=1 Tax=Speluncibacter jeojiensis TaxID=2710754 RepID=A0A9X4RDR8_9ACTN|nr:TauD/TfdA family dioxygenase [Rhodococcus sp. D2-41]MDG3011641.1 taurine dioxygenase [Rhodococcus sp. D2-41]MDG3015004.1 TauD/TfdA family dioxygenase [Corynebacteriales bacterium D3-21]